MIKPVQILFESERRVGSNPLDFLQLNHIQNGQFVSIGYLMEEKLSTTARRINTDNDKRLEDEINRNPESRFGRDFTKVRQNQAYQKALLGTAKTGNFVFETPVHILKLGRYNFQWRNAKSFWNHYETAQLPLERALRQKYGIPDKEPKLDYIPAGYKAIGQEGADFFEHTNTKNIAFRQILNSKNMEEYSFYYVVEGTYDDATKTYSFAEDEGILEPLTTTTFYFLSQAFSKPKVEKAADEILDNEREFKKEMDELKKGFKHRTYNWDKVLYFVGSTVGKDENGKRVFEPFVWINDDIIKQTYPYVRPGEMDTLIDNSVRLSNVALREWRKTPQGWEKVSSAVAENRNKINGIKKVINEQASLDKKRLSGLYKQIYEDITASINNILDEQAEEWGYDDPLVQEVIEIIESYGGKICITDEGFTAEGKTVDYITYDDDKLLSFWSGDPDDDDAEYLIVEGDSQRAILKYIQEYF